VIYDDNLKTVIGNGTYIFEILGEF